MPGLLTPMSLLPGFGAASPGESLPLAKAAAKKAIELDDALAEAHNSLALVLICTISICRIEEGI